MSRLLVIGCGGVASVAIRKCCQNSDVFTEIMIASRTKEKCDALKEKIESTTKTKIETAKVDADNAAEVAEHKLCRFFIGCFLPNTVDVIDAGVDFTALKIRQHIVKHTLVKC